MVTSAMRHLYQVDGASAPLSHPLRRVTGTDFPLTAAPPATGWPTERGTMPLVVHHRLPVPGVDRIDSHELALLTVTAAMAHPLRDETIVVLLDGGRRSVAMVVVSGTVRPDSVVDVLECLIRPEVHEGLVAAAIVASVRPGRGVSEADIDRWLELSDVADEYGIDLIEWFVLGTDGAACPRDLIGELPRW